MSETQTFTLSKPITTHQGVIDKLVLKYPTARCFMKYGMPYSTVREGDETDMRSEFRINAKAMFKFIADMSGLDEIALEEIDGRDVSTLMFFVVGMLNSAVPRTSST